MNALEIEILTALWDGSRNGDELFSVFSSTVGQREVSFKDVIEGLTAGGMIKQIGTDQSGDEVYEVTENGVEACGKYLYSAEVGKGGKFRKKRRARGYEFDGFSESVGADQISRDRATTGEHFWFFIVWILAPTCGLYVLAWWIKELNR